MYWMRAIYLMCYIPKQILCFKQNTFSLLNILLCINYVVLFLLFWPVNDWKWQWLLNFTDLRSKLWLPAKRSKVAHTLTTRCSLMHGTYHTLWVFSLLEKPECFWLYSVLTLWSNSYQFHWVIHHHQVLPPRCVETSRGQLLHVTQIGHVILIRTVNVTLSTGVNCVLFPIDITIWNHFTNRMFLIWMCLFLVNQHSFSLLSKTKPLCMEYVSRLD